MEKASVRERVAAWGLPSLNLVFLVVFFALDLRDIYFNVMWLGPYNSFGFSAMGTSSFDAAPLVPASYLNISSLNRGDEVNFTSGWPSFLSQCESLHASPGFFLAAKATKCQLGSPPKQIQANDIILESNIRVDAAAWAACKLLYLHRRPPICQENVVTEFIHRYRLGDPNVTTESVAEPNSEAEQELLQLLDLISRSYPLSSVVCTEGFYYGGPGEYPSSTVYACASANVYDAAFVGYHAPAFAELQSQLVWLTVDVLNVLGFEFVIRQNCRSLYYVPPSTPDNRLTMEHTTVLNFSSYGHLYILAILIDLILLGAHVRSALETATVLVAPMLGTDNDDDVKNLHRHFSWSILYRSLYRSTPIVILTVLSGLLSWQIQMPNSIIWTWNLESSGKAHAILSSIRVWMLVVCLVHQLWSLVVMMSETKAYWIAKRTFVTTTEVLIIAVIVAVAQQKITFAISGEKYAVEGQRLWDTDSFPGHIAYANVFTEDQDYLLSTSSTVLKIVHSPMLVIVLQSLLVTVGYLVLKFIFFTIRHRTGALIENDAESLPQQVYERLPIEELLRVPIRAQSLVRNCFELEIAADQQLYIPPSIYFEFGVILDNDIIRTRRGFLNVIHLKVDVAKYFTPIPSGSPSSVASMTAIPTPVNLQRPSSFFGVANNSTSPGSVRSNPLSPAPRRSVNDKAITDAVLATDVIRPPSASSKDSDTEGRRPLAETAGSPAARSMRRRKSITELVNLDDGC